VVEFRFGIRWGKEQENGYLMEVQPHTHLMLVTWRLRAPFIG